MTASTADSELLGWPEPASVVLIDPRGEGPIRAERLGLEGLEACAARLASGDELPCDRLILAVGHSARATYERLVELGVAAEPKPFAIGARVEHPQPLIDQFKQFEAPPYAYDQVRGECGTPGYRADACPDKATTE